MQMRGALACFVHIGAAHSISAPASSSFRAAATGVVAVAVAVQWNNSMDQCRRVAALLIYAASSWLVSSRSRDGTPNMTATGQDIER